MQFLWGNCDNPRSSIIQHCYCCTRGSAIAFPNLPSPCVINMSGTRRRGEHGMQFPEWSRRSAAKLQIETDGNSLDGGRCHPMPVGVLQNLGTRTDDVTLLDGHVDCRSVSHHPRSIAKGRQSASFRALPLPPTPKKTAYRCIHLWSYHVLPRDFPFHSHSRRLRGRKVRPGQFP